MFYHFQVHSLLLQVLPSSSPPIQQNDCVRIILISTFIVCMQMYTPKMGPLKSSPLNQHSLLRFFFSVNPSPQTVKRSILIQPES